MSEPSMKEYELPVKEIKIIVNQATQEISAVPSAARVSRNQPITWQLFTAEADRLISSPGSFLLVFPDGQPVDELEIRGASTERVMARVVEDAPYGIFHYAVIASIDGRIYADVTCNSVGVGK